MKAYAKGRRFEYEVRDDLKSGFFIVRQAKSAFPDLIGIRKLTGKKICIECKVNGRLSKKEKNKLIEIWVRYDIHPFLAYKEKGKIKYFDLLFGEEVNEI